MRMQWTVGLTWQSAWARRGPHPSRRRPGRTNPPLVIESVAGNDVCAFYCASCHGRSGGGDGPIARSLKVPPADLRLLARHNHGEFPRLRVEAFLTHGDGASAPAHGTSDMPVWGPVFKGLGDTETLSRVRVANLVQYLESIQQK